MSGCGYVCPKCEGKGFTDDGEECDWCKTTQSDIPLEETND